MNALGTARHLAALRVDVVERRYLGPGERLARAQDYLRHYTGAPVWIRGWSVLLTWHLDKVEREQLTRVCDQARELLLERERLGRHHLREDHDE